MAEKKVPVFVCTDDETDSADEAFVFTRKRKGDVFFIDLTDEQSKCKKAKTELESKVKYTCSDNVDTSGVEDEGATGDPDIQVVKVIPGEESDAGSSMVAEAVKQQPSTFDDECSVVKVSVPKLMSPPCVVRVVGAPYMAGEVIDLTKPPHVEISKSSSDDGHGGHVIEAMSSQKEDVIVSNNAGSTFGLPDSDEYAVKADDFSQNQLGDPVAHALYDNILVLGQYNLSN